MSGGSSPERQVGTQAEGGSESHGPDHVISLLSEDYSVNPEDINPHNIISSFTQARAVRRNRRPGQESSNSQSTAGTASASSGSRIQSHSQGGGDSGLPSSVSFATGSSAASAGHTSGQDSGIHNRMDASMNTRGQRGGEPRGHDDDHGPESIPYQSVNEPDSPPSGRNTSSQRKNTKK